MVVRKRAAGPLPDEKSCKFAVLHDRNLPFIFPVQLKLMGKLGANRMQSPQDKRKNFIDILSDTAEPQRVRPSSRSLTNSVLAFIASLWARSRETT